MARISNNVAVSAAARPKKNTVTLPYSQNIYGENAAPAGTYNPQIGQEVERSREELNDFLLGLGTSEKNKKQELSQRRREINRGYSQGVSDTNRTLGYDQSDLNYKLGQLGINFSRSIEDLSTAKQRGQQDYERTLTNLQHEYGARAEQQTQNAIQQGDNEGGTSAASAAVRGANEAYDKSNVDLTHQRSEEDYARQQGRLEQDYGSDVDRANEGFGRQQTAATISNNRAAQAAQTQQKGLTHSWLDTLHQYATEASQKTAAQQRYETAAGEDSYYEASKLHPGIHFPGSTQPGTATQGPHALAPATPAGNPIGINIGRSRRLGAPRY